LGGRHRRSRPAVRQRRGQPPPAGSTFIPMPSRRRSRRWSRDSALCD
jgi:hypothetical protein